MTTQEKIQRRNRFYFYIALLVVCIGLSFWSGYQLGRTAEHQEWIEGLIKDNANA